MRRRALLGALFGITIVWAGTLTGCSDDGPPCGDRPLDATERACLVDEITHRVDKEYPFAALNGIELDEWSTEVQGLADEEMSEVKFLRKLEIRVSELKDGHTNLAWAAPGTGAGPPAEAQMLEEGCFISSVGQTDAPIERGDRVMAIEGMPVEQRFRKVMETTQASTSQARRRYASRRLLRGSPGTSVTVEIEGEGEVEMPRQVGPFEPVPTPTSKKFGDVGYIVPVTFGFIDDIDRIDRLLNDLMGTEALIIDLRRNGGGAIAVPDALLGRLFDDAPRNFVIRDRNGDKETNLGPGSRGKTYHGKVAVLTGAHTFSAANYFAQRIKYHERGVIIGRRTGGGAGIPTPSVELARGVYFRVSGNVVKTPAGEHSEKGISPDIEVPLTPEALKSTPIQKYGDPERDRVLSKALEYLRSQTD